MLELTLTNGTWHWLYNLILKNRIAAQFWLFCLTVNKGDMLYLYVSHLGNTEFVDGTVLSKVKIEIAA